MRESAAILVSFAMAAMAAAQPMPGSLRALETGAAARPKVLIVGTDHAPTCFLSAPGYSNAHLRVVLNNFRPTMIGVESNPVWMSRGIINRVTYEAQVAIDWAAKDHIPVHGLDWAKLEDLAESSRAGLKRARDADPPAPGVRRLREEAQRLSAALKPFREVQAKHPADLLTWMNTEGTKEEGMRRAEFLRKAEGAQKKALEDLEYRNDRISEQILALARRYPGGRLAVLMGFAHKWPLEQRLAEVADIELVRWPSLPAITAEAVDSAWMPKDSLGTLRESLDGALGYFNPEGVNLGLAAEHLARLQKAGVASEEVRYFRARLLVLEKKYAEAEALLRPIGASTSGAGFSYRLTNGWWEFPVAFMARLELAKIADLKQNRAEAVAGYTAALRELEQMTPAVPADESFRDLEAWITDGHFAFYRIWTCQAARRALQSMVKEPFGEAYGRGGAER